MAAATARVVVLMTPEEKDRIALQAKLEGISVGEFIRRSAAGQMSDAELEAELEKRRPELEALLDELERSNEQALKALDDAEAALRETREYFNKPRAERVAG